MGERLKCLLAGLLCVVTTRAVPSYAVDSDAADAKHAIGETVGTRSEVTTQSQELKGAVKKVEISLETLRDVGLDLKEIMTSSRHLYDEVTIQPVTLITQPSMVGPGTIINIPIGTMPVGPVQPPRKTRVDVAMNSMSPIINMFKQNADDFVREEKQLDVSPEAKVLLDPLVQDWIANVDKIYSQLQQLVSLTRGPVYDNGAIASVCQDMQRTAGDLDKIRNKMFKIIKKENRR